MNPEIAAVNLLVHAECARILLEQRGAQLEDGVIMAVAPPLTSDELLDHEQGELQREALFNLIGRGVLRMTNEPGSGGYALTPAYRAAVVEE